MSAGLPNRDSPFAETETLLAALEGSAPEVGERVAIMLPSERRELIRACTLVTEACCAANRAARAGGQA